MVWKWSITGGDRYNESDLGQYSLRLGYCDHTNVFFRYGKEMAWRRFTDGKEMVWKWSGGWEMV